MAGRTQAGSDYLPAIDQIEAELAAGLGDVPGDAGELAQ